MRKIILTVTSSVVLISILTGCSIKQLPDNSLENKSEILINENQAISNENNIKKIEIIKETTAMQPMPIKSPDKIVRILTLPYVDSSGVLHSQSFKFVKVDDGEWIIGHYLSQKNAEHTMTLTPLK